MPPSTPSFSDHNDYEPPREISRATQRRRSAKDHISSCALELAHSQGVENVTVDDIAAAAGISRRTFFNYFPSKNAAIVPNNYVRDVSAEEQLFNGNTTSTLTAIGEFLAHRVQTEQARNTSFEKFHTLWAREPTLRPEVSSYLFQTEKYIAGLIGHRDKIDPHSIEARALAAAAIGVMRVAVEQWQADQSPESLAKQIRQAFAAVGSSSIHD